MIRTSVHQILSLKLNLKSLWPSGATALIIPSRNNKVYDPKFRKLRGRKFLKIQLPDFDEIRNSEKMSVQEIRAKMKEKGIAPRREWNEKPMYISCTGSVMDGYVPQEGEGKISIVSKAGLKQKIDVIGKKGKTFKALRKIRRFEDAFDVPSFAEKAQEIYIEAHGTLTKFNEEGWYGDRNVRNRVHEDRLHELVTESCYPEIMENLTNKTIRWKFVQSLEIPRVIQVRCEEFMSEANIFAQITVKFHTQQILAVYDRFGRLMHGSEDVVKDVMEYVVFEKHLTNAYGNWRMHAKIIPEWQPISPVSKTFVKPTPPEPSETPKDNSDVIDVESATAPQSAVA